ncbi:flagellar hook-basal body complex protein FliE [Desulfovibrio ferrophilus]|uniref:Flagellar hook-basal body complex protein FliE n=1 Tax=Desulfovibrio ferrophilus TaxID=241368 RepID=A0A2Z6B1J9_9BACT|nr:flagellar hook-basal body complex protein FliE [Desulfovibrio ferrophilus]BBD09345.1 flagellar hook-basal body complex subunit FliE [Desulfovibrio ferrophilus]
MAINNIAMNAYRSAIESGKVHQRGADSLTKIGKQGTSGHMRVGSGNSFEKTVSESLKKVNDLQTEKTSMIEAFASGEKQNVHELMISLQKAGLAMKMTSAVRNKVMDAYRELSKMSF